MTALTLIALLAFAGVVGSVLAAIGILERNLDDHQPPFLPE